MATVTERLEQVIQEESPSVGIEPVPPQHRRLSSFDFGVLWGDLSLGLLVILTGTLLVPALGLPRALGAIVVGSVIGCIPLALVGLAGAREGVPGMVLFRPVLGRRGSYVPSVLNIAQLIGWTGFELWAMALVANQIVHLSYWVWLPVAAIVCGGLALGGPILVVRRWLERFGAWVVAAVGAWITFRVLTTAELGSLWSRTGEGGLGFWLAVDLAIVMPVSWLPLVADYNRFARTERGSAAGTFAGYAAGNIWFYALGALLVLGAGLSDTTPAGLGTAIASLAGGWIVLLALLVGESDEAFADIYSAAVSSQNLAERIPQRAAILAVAGAGVALAVWLGLRPSVALGNYESFLFLLGSVFVPLFGVFIAEYFLVRWRGTGEGFNVRAFVAWTLGFLVYQWSVPTGPGVWTNGIETLLHGWLRLPFPLLNSSAGASIPSFVAAMAVYLLLSRLARRAADRLETAGPGAVPPDSV